MTQFTDPGSPPHGETDSSRVAAAQETAAVLADRVKNRDAQLRRSFVRRGKSKNPTPMMRMLRGGRGGEVRLKLYLSLLWVAVAPPHAASYPARTWAALLGLPDPGKLGARRVSDALNWLEEESFVVLHGGRGTPPAVQLLEESGSGASYTVPGARISQLNSAGRPWQRHAYDKLPVTLWAHGWLGVMSGPALACYLVLNSVPKSESEVQEGSWFSQSLLQDRYDMSDDTRQRGMRDLQRLGLVSVRREVLARSSVDFQRRRNMYVLNTSRLAMPPKLIG